MRQLKYLLVIVNHLTKQVEASPSPGGTANHTVMMLLRPTENAIQMTAGSSLPLVNTLAGR